MGGNTHGIIFYTTNMEPPIGSKKFPRRGTEMTHNLELGCDAKPVQDDRDSITERLMHQAFINHLEHEHGLNSVKYALAKDLPLDVYLDLEYGLG